MKKLQQLMPDWFKYGSSEDKKLPLERILSEEIYIGAYQIFKKGVSKLTARRDDNEIYCPSKLELTIDRPATYCIQIVGNLDESWSDRLGGLKIDSTSREGQKAITTLSGPLLDQAALFGVLKALYDLRLPLLSVECLELN